MTMKIFCDVCGKEIEKENYEITIRDPDCNIVVEWDLCSACYEKLKLILESFKESEGIQV